MNLDLTNTVAATAGNIWWWVLGIAVVVGLIWWWSAAGTRRRAAAPAGGEGEPAPAVEGAPAEGGQQPQEGQG